MKFSFKNKEDAMETLDLIGGFIKFGLQLYMQIKKSVVEADNINYEDKEEVLKALDKMKLPDWDDL